MVTTDQLYLELISRSIIFIAAHHSVMLVMIFFQQIIYGVVLLVFGESWSWNSVLLVLGLNI